MTEVLIRGNGNKDVRRLVVDRAVYDVGDEVQFDGQWWRVRSVTGVPPVAKQVVAEFVPSTQGERA